MTGLPPHSPSSAFVRSGEMCLERVKHALYHIIYVAISIDIDTLAVVESEGY